MASEPPVERTDGDPAPPEKGPESHETVVDEKSRRNQRLRLLALGLLFVGSLVLVKVTGLDEHVNREAIRDFMDAAGPWGFALFVAGFAVGELMHIPGMVFVGAASIAYGPWLGSAAAYAGALGSVCASFFVVRGIGGQPLGQVRRPIVRRLLGRLDEHPITTVAILRFIFWMAPALNYGLAMSKVRFRDYLIGSAIGLAIPIPVATVFFDWVTNIDLAAWAGALTG